MNHVTLFGRLTRDAWVSDQRGNGSGSLVLFTMATRTGWDKEKKEERTAFVPVKVFNVPDKIRDLLVKGAEVIFEGRVEQSKFQKDGKDTWETQVVGHGGGLRLPSATWDGGRG